jgi:hypothetical protein
VAERHIAEEFSVPIKGAKSAEQKAYLVDRLLRAAAEAEDAANQYALVSEACARAAMAGDVERALASVDELARWFDVDALALKTETLAKAGGAARDAETARQVTDAALGLLAEVGDRDELRKSLTQTAVAAARRTRDPELVKKAVERRREIERPAKKPAKAADSD